MCSETETFPVPLLRRETDKNPYLCEIIRPYRVYQAAKVLVEKDAYKEEGVTLSDTWSKFEPDDTIEVSSTRENDKAPTQEEDDAKSTTENQE
jgi:hypothetical protein